MARLSLIFTLLLVAGCGPVYESAHVRVYYRAGAPDDEERVRERVGPEMDRYAAAVGRFFEAGGEPIEVVFEGSAGVSSRCAHYGDPESAGAVYQVRGFPSEPVPLRASALHGLAHACVARRFGSEIPTWLSEGLAEWVANGLVIDGEWVARPFSYQGGAYGQMGPIALTPTGKMAAVPDAGRVIESLLAWKPRGERLHYMFAQAVVGFLLEATEGKLPASTSEWAEGLRERADELQAYLARPYDPPMATYERAMAASDARDRFEALRELVRLPASEQTAAIIRKALASDDDPRVIAQAATAYTFHTGVRGEKAAAAIASRVDALTPEQSVEVILVLHDLTGAGPNLKRQIVTKGRIKTADLHEAHKFWKDWATHHRPAGR